jgi:hypothetical protein
MPSSTSNSDFDFERPIPAHPWRNVLLVTVALTLCATVAWEWRVRAMGYAPTLDDSPDLWAQQRRQVQPESIVIIGDSRPHFDLDLTELERGLGRRPVQLALDGSCAYPVFADLVADEKFHGTIIASIVPLMWFAPAGSPPYENSTKALKRFHSGTVAQRWSNVLWLELDERLAFLQADDLTLDQLLKRLPIANRPGALVPPKFPPYFCTLDRERRARMTDACANSPELQHTIQQIWLPLFTPPPPPTFVPKEVFAAEMNKGMEARFKDTVAAVHKFRARGGKVVFVRFPFSGGVKQIEDQLTPKAGPWDNLIKASGAPGIYFEDFPELASFTLPEWSHLSGPDSVEFTRRLVPHLKKALAP